MKFRPINPCRWCKPWLFPNFKKIKSMINTAPRVLHLMLFQLHLHPPYFLCRLLLKLPLRIFHQRKSLIVAIMAFVTTTMRSFTSTTIARADFSYSCLMMLRASPILLRSHWLTFLHLIPLQLVGLGSSSSMEFFASWRSMAAEWIGCKMIGDATSRRRWVKKKLTTIGSHG